LKISIDAGHNCKPDSGAVGIRKEDDLTKQVVASIIKLIPKTVRIYDCTPYGKTFSNITQSLAFRVDEANIYKSDLHLCIHFNAGGGEGIESYAISTTGKKYASQICFNIAALGYKNRGVKDGSHLYVVKNTNMPCVLVECSFIDNVHDMKIYNADAIANAIIKAVI